MSEMTIDQTFDLFAKQWAAQDAAFHLDDPKIREEVVVVISAMMSLLAVAPPEVWDQFMKECSATAKALVPKEIQDQIKSAVP